MAAINVQILNPADKTYLAARAIGTGAPASTDILVTNIVLYPTGSEYLDTAAPKLWRRIAQAGLTTDWVGVVLA